MVNIQISSIRSSLNLVVPLVATVLAIVLYLQYGAWREMPAYLNESSVAKRQNQALLRPMYNDLQRELLKSKLDMPFELDNLDLIISFANINSQLGEGILPKDVKQLLLAVLKSFPEQVTALNLLAIDSYRNENLRAAIDYWQRILNLADRQQMNSDSVTILRNKVAETEQRISKFESIQTNM